MGSEGETGMVKDGKPKTFYTEFGAVRCPQTLLCTKKRAEMR